MKLVILDGYTENPGDLSWDGLQELAEVTVYDRTSLTDPAQTIARIADAEIVLTNTPVSLRMGTLNELAAKCNRSLTSFKKEFRRHFQMPPHKWYIRQRLMHSRLLLISTNKSISEIGLACNFPNTSHFIKLFKKEYGMTPAAYRRQTRLEQKNRSPEQDSRTRP